MVARILAALVVAAALDVQPVRAQHPEWAVAIGRSFCGLRQSGMGARRAMLTALRQHLPTWRNEVREVGTRQMGLRIGEVIIEECPQEAADLAEELERQPGGSPPSPASKTQASPPANSQSCSSFILVNGRKQCM